MWHSRCAARYVLTPSCRDGHCRRDWCHCRLSTLGRHTLLQQPQAGLPAAWGPLFSCLQPFRWDPCVAADGDDKGVHALTLSLLQVWLSLLSALLQPAAPDFSAAADRLSTLTTGLPGGVHWWTKPALQLSRLAP